MTPEVIAREKAGSKLQIIPFKRGKKASNSTHVTKIFVAPL